MAEVMFDVQAMEDRLLTAGKEDVNKLSRRISEFLVDIKKTGWEFKLLLQQHNNIKSLLDSNQNKNYYIFSSKLILMLVILLVQFYAIKHFFK